MITDRWISANLIATHGLENGPSFNAVLFYRTYPMMKNWMSLNCCMTDLPKVEACCCLRCFVSNEQADEASPDQHQILNIQLLYDQFIGEAQECLINGILTQDQYNSLCGTLETEGLISSKHQAVQGHRDYFLSLEKHNLLLLKAGFVDMRCYQNRLNRFLGVISALKRE